MYCFTKHLSLLRQKIKRWCLDHKIVWGIDWKDITDQLTTSAVPIDNIQQGNAFMSQRQEVLNRATLAHTYWSQRSKDKFIQDGELSTKLVEKGRFASPHLRRTDTETTHSSDLHRIWEAVRRKSQLCASDYRVCATHIGIK